MPLEGFWNVEWPNGNSQRKYPFSQEASLASGTFVIPNDLIVDLVLPVNTAVSPVLDPTLFHLSQLGVFSNGVVLSLAYNGETFATLNVAVSDFVPYKTFQIQGTNDFFDTRGWVTLGDLQNTLKYPGAWTFDVAASRFHPMTIRPDLRTVASLTVVNVDDVSDPFTGDIAFVAGTNFRFRVDTTEAVPQIIFDAIKGEDLEDECECDDLDVDAPCIRKISGVVPNAVGEILLTGSTCISVEPGQHQLTLNDDCSEPCCDCRELQIVTDTLDQMLQQMITLEGTGVRLDEVQTNMRVNLYASKTTGLPRV